MKKLLLGAIVVFGGILGTQAQTILYHNFNTTTTAMPLGWDTGYFSKHPGNPGWQFNNTFPSCAHGLFAEFTALHGYVAYVDDIDFDCTAATWANDAPFGTGDYDTLYLKSINCSAYTHVFMSFDLNFNNYTGKEVGTLIYSINGGANWNLAETLPSVEGNTAWQDSLIYDISTYAAGQANVILAFAWNNNGAAICACPDDYAGWGMALDNINVYSPPPYDVQVASQNTFYLMKVNDSYTFSGTANNFGSTTITQMQMNYSVNGVTQTPQTILGIGGFTGLTTYDWSMPNVPFKPLTAGNYTVKFWASELNGSNNNTNTDTLVVNFVAAASIATKVPLYEEFTGQSCVFCMLAAPNMDSVYTQNSEISSIVRYHVPIPARDFMYDANVTPIEQRETFYNVDEAPYGLLDGTYLNPSAYQSPPENTIYSSTTLQAEDTIGSSFSIDITSAEYIAKKDSFYVSATITSSSAFAAGLTAQVALNIDSITYKFDLSMDDPCQSFASPIGTGAAGFSYTDCPDYSYPFVLKYPYVTEEMFPNTGKGTSLGLFTPNVPQTVSFGWKKNHPWGLYDKPTAQRDSDFYDSSKTCHFVVWVQTPTAIPTLGIPAQYVFQSATSKTVVTGVDEVSIGDGVTFAMYPNPANSSTNLAFKLDNNQNVNIEVYNMLGQSVYTANQGMMQAGDHTISINSSGLQSGIYIVRFSTDNASTTQKLIIQK